MLFIFICFIVKISLLQQLCRNEYLIVFFILPIQSFTIFETNYSFHVKQCSPGKVWFLFFKSFLSVFFGRKTIILSILDPKSYVVWQLVRQLIYSMFVSNNGAFFQLWWNENLVKHQKVSHYYQNDYLQNFLLLLSFW